MSKKIVDIIKNAKNIVALTGAGISTNAGIPDFRGKNGIYTSGEYDPYKTFDIDYYKIDPSHFFRFAKSFLELLKEAKPTKMHRFLTGLETIGKKVTIITQNIDMLHEKAGSKNVLNLHGSIKSGYCLNCNRRFRFEEMESMLLKTGMLKCPDCNGLIKPDIVFFGEPVQYIKEAIEEIQKCDLLFILGTSLSISPANILPGYAREETYKVIINRGEVYYSGKNVIKIDDDLDSVAEYFTKEIINENTCP